MLDFIQLVTCLITASVAVIATGDDPGSGRHWPSTPLWFNGVGAPPPNENLGQPNAMFPFSPYQNNPGTNAPNAAMGWHNAYPYGQFGHPQAYGFMQAPPPMFYGGFPPSNLPVPNDGTAAPPSHGEDVDMTPSMASNADNVERSTAVNAVAGPSRARTRSIPRDREPAVRASRWRSPSPRRARSHRESDVESDNSARRRDRKGKQKAMEHEMEARRYSEERCQRRQEESDRERARRCTERATIPRHIIEMQERELREPQGPREDSTATALRQQIALNLELMKKLNNFGEGATKRRHSPGGNGDHSAKRPRDSQRQRDEHRRCTDAELDDFLAEDRDYPIPRRPRGRGLHDRTRGRGGPASRGCEPAQAGRAKEKTVSSRQKQPADAVTVTPLRLQRLPDEDTHDELLNSYDQRRFGHLITDERMPLEERVADLSTELPAMPLPDGSYPTGMHGDDSPRPLNSVQAAQQFMERRAQRLRHPGRLPSWLNLFRSKDRSALPERDNSFHGMYGPGFTYDSRTNVMYTDQEAVDAARAMADGVVYATPRNIDQRPNPRGFPMNRREVQESVTFVHMRQNGWQATLRLLCEFHRISEAVILRYRDLSMHEVIEHFERDNRLRDLQRGMLRPYFIELNPRCRVTGEGSVGSGTGVLCPVNGTLDDWCQYVAHHFRPGGLNPACGVIMDTSYRVSYTSMWGLVLLRLLHPNDAKNYYGRYLAGIAFRPQFYSDYIRRWNRDRPQELPITIVAGSPTLQRMTFNGAGENLSELDVVRHLALCGITQGMIDNTYPWALVWIDQHVSVHFRDLHGTLELERRDRIQWYGEPRIGNGFRGWWSPSAEDTHHIRAMLYYERYEHQPSGRIHNQIHQYTLLRGESSIFTWLNSFPPTAPSLASPTTHTAVDSGDGDTTMAPREGTDDTSTETAPNCTVDDAMMDDDPPDSDTNTSELVDELDKTHIAPRARSE